MKKALCAILSLLAVTAAGWSQQVSFKLFGGQGSIQGDDYNSGVAGQMAYIRDTMSSISGAYAQVKKGPAFQFEIMTHWGRRIATGLGGGYYQIEQNDLVSGQGMSGDVPFTAETRFKPQLSVIPFYLNVYYKVNLGSRLGFDIFAGPVFQIVQFTFERQTDSSLNSLSEKETYRAAAPSLGVQAGIGLRCRIAGGSSFIADVLYRSAKATNLMGNWALYSTSSSGTVSNSSAEYYYYSYDYNPGKNYRRIGFFDKNGPSGEGISGARKANINLTGFSVLVGLKFDI